MTAEFPDSNAPSADSGELGAPVSDSAADAAAGGQRVEFYVIEESAPAARLKLACRLAEKAYLAEQRALVWLGDAEALKQFDDLLWTFADRSFVPHEVLGTAGSTADAPVLLSMGAAPAQPFDILINLAPDVPSIAAQAPRIAEIIDGDEGRRRAGRARFKTYRDRGIQPVTHTIRAE